jgi:alanyl aminopeptidase
VSSVADDIPYGQLGVDVVPTSYQLTLNIVPELDHFSGRAVIELEIAEPLEYFYLHGKNLAVSKVQMAIADSRLDASYKQVDKSGIARISLPQAVSGSARLEIEYSAPFGQSLAGLYKVSESGEDYAFTQFEAISARKAFPGFDEPGFKAPFDITLIVPENQVAISNTPEISSELKDGMKVVQFATSKPLPTYLIAFAVGDLDVVEWTPLPATDIRPRELPLRGIAAKGKGDQLAYALEGTNAIVTALESYFGTPYPWAKLDILAVPDFAAGAMENAGAITYRESLLLFDDTATPERKRRYKMVHAHELAHQWFGDLVTPAWWNDIWLNESFATWMAFVAMDFAEPQGNYRRDLISRGLKVMASDSLVNARQIRQPILSNNDISTAFDGITYSKGGAVLSMFENFLGREDFRQGVRNYMQEFQYGAATADDFIRHLGAASTSQPKEIVVEAFNSFLEQPGLPLIEMSSQCTGEGVNINLRQSRYFPLGSSGDRDQVWKVPVCLSTPNANKTCLMLTQKELDFKLSQACPEWVMPNANSAGYYRFSMRMDDWNKLLANSDRQNTEEMMAILGSLTGAFNSGDLDIETLMSIAPQLIASSDWQVATSPMDQMIFMYDRMATEGQKQILEQRFAEFYSSKLDDTGLDVTEDRDKASLQTALVTFLAETAKQPELRSVLVKMAVAYTGYGTDGDIHPEAANPIIIDTALLVAVDELGDGFTDHLLGLALGSTDAVVRGRALGAIGNTKDPDKAKEIRELVFSEDLRDNEIYSILFPQAMMAETRGATWEWFQQNIDKILERIPEAAWGRMTMVGSAFCDVEKQIEIEDFFGERIGDLTGGPRNLAKTLEGIDLCIAKVQHHQAEMEAWLGQ